MKNSYKTLLSSIAIGSVFALAQAPANEAPAAQPAPAVAEQPATQPAAPAEQPAAAPAPAEQAPAAQAPAQQPAAPAEQAAQPAPAEQAAPQAAEAAPAAEEKVAEQAPAANDSTAQQPVAPADSAVASQPASTDSLAAAPAAPDSVTAAAAQPADSTQAAPVADSAAVAAASADSAKFAFVADTTTPPPSLLEGSELAGEVSGFLKIDKSPYLVTENIVVAPNKSLIIEPGVVLYFKTGTGLQVNRGQLVIAGSRISPVTFRSAFDRAKAGDWNGITITGDERAEIRNVVVSDAVAGIAVENGAMDLQNAKIENTAARCIYVRNASVNISDCEFTGNAVGLHISNYAIANVERGTFTKNKVAILNSELAETRVTSTMVAENETGLLNMGNSFITLSNTEIGKNEIGVSSVEVLDPEIIEKVVGNTVDLNNEAAAAVTTLPPSPEIAGVESRPIIPSDKIGIIVTDRINAAVKMDSTKSRWNVLGNVMLGGSFHYVSTSENDTKDTVFLGTDTITPGMDFKNNFQVPGLAGRASAYVLMQSSDGETIEFNADLTADSWNHFSPNPVTLKYTDAYNKLVLGDYQLIGGDTYLAGLPIFGGDYTVSLLKNNADQPLFQLNGFVGEARRSLVEGARHPYLYNDYIDDGELQAQRLAYGGFVKWAPVRRFDAKVGVIYANDELEDPLLRDGASSSWSTSDPMQESFTLYADGNWLFFPGDIELNGQIAVGRADTADVVRQRAINKVFSDAGISPASYSLLRQLMQNENKITRLTNAELVSIFGDNTTLNRSQMIEKLRSLIREAKVVQKEEEDDRDDGRVLGLNWGSQNFAIGASLNWNIYKTSINGHIKYVGEDFYSAGSPNQLSDTREFGGRLEQEILSFWDLGLSYQINVENAAKGDKTNIFGIGEGTEWGLFAKGDGTWYDEHELDNDRTKYIHNAGLDNSFKINNNVDVSVTYNFEYKTQYRPFQLHHDFILEDGIYRDNWFDVRKGRDSTRIADGKDTSYVDAERWGEYMNLASAPFLATRFQERLFKHTFNLGTSVKAFNSVLKFNGIWTVRTDGSEFHRDSLVEDMDLSNETWNKLGYYFGGSNYFEQSYPLSVSTSLAMLQNRFAVTPRIKSYNRDDMSEFEINIEDEFEMPFMERFLILGVNVGFRYMSTDWEEDGESFDETETDITASANLRVNHNKKFYTEWYAGTGLFFRPDNLSNEYKDIYVGVNAFYVF